MDLSKIVKKKIFEKIVCKDLKREKILTWSRPDDVSKTFRPNFEKSKIKFFL